MNYLLYKWYSLRGKLTRGSFDSMSDWQRQHLAADQITSLPARKLPHIYPLLQTNQKRWITREQVAGIPPTLLTSDFIRQLERNRHWITQAQVQGIPPNHLTLTLVQSLLRVQRSWITEEQVQAIPPNQLTQPFNLLLVRRKFAVLIDPRPPTNFAELSPEAESIASARRRAWIAKVMAANPRVDSKVMPRFSEAVQPWLPKNLSPSQRTRLTEEFAKLDTPMTDALAAFTAFVYMAEATADFQSRPEAYRERMWNLLSVVIDKNHPSLQKKDKSSDSLIGFDDDEHANLRDALFADVTEALGACVDRLANSFKRLEKIIKYHAAANYTTLDENVAFLAEMFIDHTKDGIAKVLAAQFQLDGHRFAPEHVFDENDSRRRRHKNPDEQVQINAFLNHHMKKAYQISGTISLSHYEGYVEKKAKIAKPQRYGNKHNSEIAREIAQEAEEIIEHLIAGEKSPPVLTQLIESANDTRRADGRDGDLLTIRQRSFITLEEYAEKEHPLWREFIQEHFSDLYNAILNEASRLKEEIATLEAPFVATKPRDPGEHAPPEEREKYEMQFGEWSKLHDQELSVIHDKKAALYDAEHTALPNLLKDIARQSVIAKQIMDDYAEAHDIKRAICRWEPFGRDKRAISGANYIVIGSAGGETCLRIDAAPTSIRFVTINSKSLRDKLAAESASSVEVEIKPGQKFFIRSKNGNIEHIEFDGSEQQSLPRKTVNRRRST